MPAAIQIRPSTFAGTSRLHHVYPITAMPHKGDSKCAAQRPSRFLMKKYPIHDTAEPGRALEDPTVLADALPACRPGVFASNAASSAKRKARFRGLSEQV